MDSIEVCETSIITDTVSALNKTNFQIAELLRIREALEAKLSKLLHHGDEGQTTYTVDKFKVTIKTGWIYSLDKEEYEIIKSSLPECFRPVRERTAYDIDKSVIKNVEIYGSAEENLLISKFVTKKPSKLSVKLLAGI